MQLKLNWKKCFVAMMCGLVLFSCTSASANIVTVIGEGGDKGTAINDAKRNAVENAIGTYLKSHSIVDNGQLAMDKIYTHTAGFVRSVEIISEEFSDGVYRIKARVDVSEKIEDAVAKDFAAVADMNNPRIVIRLRGIENGGSIQEQYLRECEASIVQYLVGKGLTHIKIDRGETARPQESIMSDVYARGADYLNNDGQVNQLENVDGYQEPLINESDTVFGEGYPQENLSGGVERSVLIGSIIQQEVNLVNPTGVGEMQPDKEQSQKNIKADYVMDGLLSINSNEIQLPDYKTMGTAGAPLENTGLIRGIAVLQVNLHQISNGDTFGSFQVNTAAIDNTHTMAKSKAVSAVSVQAGEKVWGLFRQGASIVPQGIELTIKTADYIRLNKIAEYLRRAGAVKNVMIRGYEEGEGLMDVDTALTPPELYRLLHGMDGFFFTMEKQTDKTLTVITR